MVGESISDNESYMEDINNIICTGEVPNLMGPEDWEEIH